MSSKLFDTKTLKINALLALALTLIVNFSHLLFSIMPEETGVYSHKLRSFNYTYWIFIQVAYFYIVSFILLSIATLQNEKNEKKLTFLFKTLYCVIIAVILYLATPIISRTDESIQFLIQTSRIISASLMLKITLVLAVSILYSKIYELIYQHQQITYENELLKNENLQNKYNVLVNQINPHFFFNSLNSLTLLVREKSSDKAIDYISRLSDTFRYIINSGQSGLTTLKKELEFIDSYKYLFEIRYENKLFFNINIDKNLYNKQIPSLSLQPLIENAVKHNVITKSQPLTINVYTKDNFLIVSNTINPKLSPSDGTGTGLKNLENRFTLLLKQHITIEQEDNIFIVKLPLIEPIG